MTTPEVRSRRLTTAAVVLALLVAIIAAALRGGYRDAPFEPSSPGPGGSKALASVLEEQGVEVAEERRTAGAADALRSGGTVLVTAPDELQHAQLEALHAALGEGDGHLVLLSPGFVALTMLAPGVQPTGTLPADAAPILADARCGDADFRARAIRAGEVPLTEDGSATAPGILYRAPEDVRACFTTPAGSAVVRSGDVTILGSARLVTNAGLRDADNPAVALNALGTSGPVTWYLPSPDDPMRDHVPGLIDRLPPWLPGVALWLVVCTLLALVALSRRLGPAVIEPLPVSVAAQELTVGRAHLLRRAGARDLAARSLRSAACVRLADRLGVRRREGLDALIAALAPHVDGDTSRLRALLGPHRITTDEQLVRLAHDLDRLEKEIDR